MKIVFYIQTRWPVGGGQILFLELASYISANYPEHEVFFVGYRTTVIEKQYSSHSFTMIDVEKTTPEVIDKLEGAVIFAPFNYVFYAAAKFRLLKNARIVFWFYHPDSIKWLTDQIYSSNIEISHFLNLIKETNSYCFQDSSNYYAIKRKCKVDFNQVYLPIFVKENTKGEIKRNNGERLDKISIGWLGRLDRDKIFSLINVLDNLFYVNLDIKIDFHIIGDGNSKQLIDVKKYSKKFRIFFTSNLYGSVRDDYLLKNVDLMVAMGMSASDSAYLGIATIVPIVSPSKFWDDKYIPIYESTGYSLGWNREDIVNVSEHCYPLNDVLQLFLNDRKAFAEKSRNYVIDNFSIQNTARIFLSIIEKTTLTIPMLLSNQTISEEFKHLDKFKKQSDDFEAFHQYSLKKKKR